MKKRLVSVGLAKFMCLWSALSTFAMAMLHASAYDTSRWHAVLITLNVATIGYICGWIIQSSIAEIERIAKYVDEREDRHRRWSEVHQKVCDLNKQAMIGCITDVEYTVVHQKLIGELVGILEEDKPS